MKFSDKKVRTGDINEETGKEIKSGQDRWLRDDKLVEAVARRWGPQTVTKTVLYRGVTDSEPTKRLSALADSFDKRLKVAVAAEAA